MAGSIPNGGRLYLRGLNWIGDAVLSLGALQGLRRVRPDIRVTVGAPSGTSGIYHLSDAVDEVMDPLSFFSRNRFDATVVLPRSFRSAWESFSLAPVRIGFASEGRSFLLTQRLDYWGWKRTHQHQSGYYERLLQKIDPAVRYEPPRLRLSETSIKTAWNRLRTMVPEGHRVLAVNPGAFYGRAKTWPTNHFVRLLEDLFARQPSLHVILFSGKADRPLAQAIERRIDNPRLHSVAGSLALEESAALLSHCDVMVTNDSGMMHLGGALERSGVALFGPTDPIATGPLQPVMGRGISVLSIPTACAPCLLRECPIDHRCMEKLTPEHVLPVILELLKKGSLR